jgi:hypothetical protein
MLKLTGFPDEMLEQMKTSEQQKLDTYLQTLSLEDLNFDIILALHTKRKNIERLEEELHQRKS